MKVVAILNHKGGVGKTTLCGSIAQALSIIGYRVLAIDNDSQHNLSTMLGVGSLHPNIRDVYRASDEGRAATLLRSIRKTALENLHVVTSQNGLCDSDVADVTILKRSQTQAQLEKFYDYILIDNAPGLGLLQECAIVACDEIFVPTELKQFAVDGIVEMAQILDKRFGVAAKLTKIIPNFYRPTKRQNSYIEALNKLFPGKVTQTSIIVDSVFDELITENKILFLHRLCSKGAAFYLKLVHELFDLKEEQVWETVKEKRNSFLADLARSRLPRPNLNSSQKTQ